MGSTLKLAWRNIFRQRRRSALTVLSMTGGFVLSSVAIGWMNGSYDNMILFFTNSRTGQIQLHAPGYSDDPSIYLHMDDLAGIARELNSVPSVENWTPRVYAGALLASRDQGGEPGVFSNSAGVMVTGIDPELEERATGFSSTLVSGEMLGTTAADSMLFAPGSILLGQELALLLDASPGDSLVLMSQSVDGASAGRRYEVSGIVSTGNTELDRSTAYITLADAQLLFGLGDAVHEIAVMTGSLDLVEGTLEDLRTATSRRDVSVEPWQVFAREFYNGMKADETSLRITIGIILAMAGLGVLNTILMMVLERRREFGVMKALGAGPGRIVTLIVAEAVQLALVSIAAGGILATLGLIYLSRNGMVLEQPLDYGGFTFSEMVASVSPECYWLPAACILVTAVLVSLLPAVKASRTDPARSLRMV